MNPVYRLVRRMVGTDAEYVTLVECAYTDSGVLVDFQLATTEWADSTQAAIDARDILAATLMPVLDESDFPWRRTNYE